MAAAYLATLDTTAQILSALRKADAAAARIQSGLGLVAHHELPLSGLMSIPAAQRPDFGRVFCKSLQISACGTFLAVSCMARKRGVKHPGPDVWSSMQELHEVVIYTTEGFQIQACLGCGSGQPSIRWAPESRHLSIALTPFPKDTPSGGAVPEIPAAVILDARTGEVLSHLSTDTVASALAQAEGRNWEEYKFWGCGDQALWSSCGTKLLVAMATPPCSEKVCSQEGFSDVSEENVSGWLGVYDVSHDRLVVESEHSGAGYSQLRVVWHPKCTGLVLSAGARLQSADAFAQAGLAVGVLPDRCELSIMQGLGFSGDAQYYLAEAAVNNESSDEGDTTSSYWLLRCTLDNVDMRFTQELEVHSDGLSWVPHSSLVITNVRSRISDSILTDLVNAGPGIRFQHECPFRPGLQAPLCFSPSGHFVTDHIGRPCIFCLKTGALLWQLASSQYSPAIEKKLAAKLLGSSFNCLAERFWLPSGRGLIYVDRQKGKVQGSPSESVYVLMFA